MLSPTYFGIKLPFSGSVHSAFWETLNWGAVDRILWMGVLCLVMWCACAPHHETRDRRSLDWDCETWGRYSYMWRKISEWTEFGYYLYYYSYFISCICISHNCCTKSTHSSNITKDLFLLRDRLAMLCSIPLLRTGPQNITKCTTFWVFKNLFPADNSLNSCSANVTESVLFTKCNYKGVKLATVVSTDR
jgi:hypothetical protein